MSIYDKASLVLIPSGTKTSKVYSQKPVNGDGDFTFSRSTAATRVNADGNIEKETQNLLVNSNSFSSSGWTTSSASVTSGQSGYDGSSDAWLLQASGTFAFVRQLGLSVNGVATASVYLKAGTTDWVNFRLSASANNQIYVNLSNGTFGTISAANLIDKSIEDVGNGWYRVSVVLNVSSLTGFYIYVADGDNTLNTTNETIYIQDAQLEQGLVARDYIETTTAAVEGGITDNVPRLDYTDSSCPALLLEPQRTNLLTNSEYLNGDWAVYRSTLIPNDDTSPEGVNNATKLQEDTTASNSHFFGKGGSYTSGTAYSFSVYVKADGRDEIVIQQGNPAVISLNAIFNFTSETATNFGNGTAKIEDAGDGWYRCIIEGTTALLSSSTNINFFLRSGGSNNYTGDGASGVLVYGAQLEAGSYATSYIPTYGTSVTRNLDSLGSNDLQASGVTNNATGWTYIVKGAFNGNGAAGNNILVQRDEGGFFYRYGSSFGFSGATKTYWTEFNPNGGFAYIWDGTQLRVRRGGTDIRTISAADIGWSAGGTSNWTINYVSIARVSFELENAFIFNQALTNEEIDSLV